MEIRKIANLSKEEIDTLVNAGKLLKEISIAFDNNELTELSAETLELLHAVDAVLDAVVEKGSK